jgi:small subunit ribosomal protein S12
MVTLQQHLRKATARRPKFHWNRTMALRNSPQKRGVVQRIGFESPKKPNSAKRRTARVRLVGSFRLRRVKIPGPGSCGVAKFSAVLVHGHHPRDLPGVRLCIIPGKLGASPLFGRRQGRSHYGLRKRMLLDHQTSAALARKKLWAAAQQKPPKPPPPPLA